MVRILFAVAAFLLPWLVYLIYMRYLARLGDDAPTRARWAPVAIAALSTAILFAAVLTTPAFRDKAPAESEYHPPVLKDGVVIPGGFERRDAPRKKP